MKELRTRYLPAIARVVLGAIFFVFGLNGFFGFIPMPPMPDAAGSFLGALAATGYLFPLIKLVETLGGVSLLVGRFVPLSLVLLAPGVVNIALFHLFLDPWGLPMAVLVVLLEGYLAWCYRDVYRPLMNARALPTERKPPAMRHHTLPGPARGEGLGTHAEGRA